jgi:hypothetical protein
MQEPGRPLLDYALRPRRSTPIAMSYRSTREDPIVDPDMIEVLLAHGANPNQPVHLYNDRSVWALFLISIHEGNKQLEPGASSKSLKTAWYRICVSLIRAGACSSCRFDLINEGLGLDTLSTFRQIFDAEQAERL